MQQGKFNILLDQSFGSSGKGAATGRLVEYYGINHVSSANLPNAGHSLVTDTVKFVAKAVPTALVLNRTHAQKVKGYVSPGSGFSIEQLVKEWKECSAAGRYPQIDIHSRALIVTPDHALREREGGDSTKHLASTMQGSGTALADKILRKPSCVMVGNTAAQVQSFYEQAFTFMNEEEKRVFPETVRIVEASEFRQNVHALLDGNNTILHEGSQGYALSVDHGFQWPFCTSRNCTAQAAMDYMAVPHTMVGDVYMNLRTFPIRVGNVVEDGKQTGFSGDFYPDQVETTWEAIGRDAGMPDDQISALSINEKTTVTKRLRRVATFSFIGLRDAVKVNGANKLIVNFPQYLDWKDNGLRGSGRSAIEKFSKKTRAFIERCENETGIPVVMIGTGAHHDDFVSL